MELEPLLDSLAVLAGQEREVTFLPGGLTNANYRVTTATRDVVVRVASASSGLLSINRDQEVHNSRAAAKAGVAPEVVEHRPGLLVVQFVPDALTYGDSDLAANLAGVADVVRRLHEGPAFAGRFDMFDIQREYLAIMHTHRFRMPRGYLALAPAAERMEAALRVHPEPRVPCHNDLLAANFLQDAQRLWIVDYEYSGMNEASFELGNIVQEAHLTPEHLAELVTAYVGHEDPVRTARAALWGIASAWAWTLWGTIQAGASDLDFDFWEWAMDKMDRAGQAFAEPGFDALLDTVGSPR